MQIQTYIADISDIDIEFISIISKHNEISSATNPFDLRCKSIRIRFQIDEIMFRRRVCLRKGNREKERKQSVNIRVQRESIGGCHVVQHTCWSIKEREDHNNKYCEGCCKHTEDSRYDMI